MSYVTDFITPFTSLVASDLVSRREYEAQKKAMEQSNTQYYNNLNWQKSQFEKEMQFQNNQFVSQMDFANRQLQSNVDIANKNYNLQQQAFNYQKELNATQMEREDSAIQRQIQDFKAAGLSPLAAIGSSGASTSALSAGNAPQMDYSGVNAAAGQYQDLARQYASLHLQAHQNYTNSRSQAAQAHNAEILGAKIGLSQMRSDMYYKGINAATQAFNSATNYKNQLLNRELTEENIKTKKYENKYYEDHGYRQTSLATVLSDFLNRNDIKSALDSFGSIIAGGLDNLSNAIKDIKVNGAKNYFFGKTDNKNYSEYRFPENENTDMLADMTEEERTYVLNWARSQNKKVQNFTVQDWLDCADYWSKTHK